MKEIFFISLSAILVENFVLVKFLGICPFLGVSKSISASVGMSFAVIFVMALSSVLTFFTYKFVLKPLEIEYMQTIAFILIIAALVQFVEMVIQKTSPSLYQALGVYLPLITTNCAVLGVALLNIQKQYSFINSLVYAVAAGIGFSIVIIMFAAIRERLELSSNVPAFMRGFPISLITAALMSIAFMGFSGLKF